MTNTAVKLQPSHRLVISVVNYHSKKKDQTAKMIETELYFALERKFPDFKLILMEEAVVGVSSKDGVHIKGTYEQKGEVIILRLQGVTGLGGVLLAQTVVNFETGKTRRKTMVAVLDLEAETLNRAQRKAFSDLFRTELSKSGQFELASSADIDKMNPDDIQKATGCTRETCATVIGEQLGVDRTISISLAKVSDSLYYLSANMMDVKDGALIMSRSVDHNGNIDTLGSAVVKLAGQLTGREEQKPETAPRTGRTGMILAKSSPPGGNIVLDGRLLKEKTDILLQDIPIGNHTVSVYKGNLGATHSFILIPDKT
ncbi:MAG: DUF2380 domain-containing protein, partial [Proteobacteria bacterium]|nr:DUF2380 domain-containing protein [Pseudomonadota bacterium]